MARSYRWFVSQIGAREHYAVPRALNLNGELDTFFTDLWIRRNKYVHNSVKGPVKALFDRNHDDLHRDKVRAYNTRFLGYELAGKLKLLRFNDEFEKYIYYGSKFAKAVTQDLKRRSLNPSTDIFFGFNTASLETLVYLKERGIQTVVDQIDPGKLEYEMVINESNRWPGWARSIPVINERYFSRIFQEWELASKIIVNSNWSRQALIQQGVPGEKVIIVPLAYEPDHSGAGVQPSQTHKEELNVLWFGSVILRKGIQYLIEAAKLLTGYNIRFTIAGPIGITEHAMKHAPESMAFVGKVPRSLAREFYVNADLFVLPTLSDGFAITQLEAMSFALPVIATPNCGEVVEDGFNGLLVRPRDAEDLATKILELYKNRDLLKKLSGNARLRSAGFSLDVYSKNIYRQILT